MKNVRPLNGKILRLRRSWINYRKMASLQLFAGRGGSLQSTLPAQVTRLKAPLAKGVKRWKKAFEDDA